MTYLDDLLDGSRRRVTVAQEREPLEALRARAQDAPTPPPFQAALRGDGVAVIAEIKRASPSRGDLARDVNAPELARAYVDGGASAVSVVTEPDQFRGALSDLTDVAALGIPVLRKDFVVHPYQVWEARAAGAAAVLLIAAAVDDATLADLADEAVAAGLDALVEVHDEADIEVARRIGATLVGINARNLRTFEVDPGAFARLHPLLDAEVVTVAESGLSGPDDVARAGRDGADAVLVGESLVTSADPAAAVAAMVAAGRPRPASASDPAATATNSGRDPA